MEDRDNRTDDERTDDEKMGDEAEELLREFYCIPDPSGRAYPFRRLQFLLDDALSLDRMRPRKPR